MKNNNILKKLTLLAFSAATALPLFSMVACSTGNDNNNNNNSNNGNNNNNGNDQTLQNQKNAAIAIVNGLANLQQQTKDKFIALINETNTNTALEELMNNIKAFNVKNKEFQALSELLKPESIKVLLSRTGNHQEKAQAEINKIVPQINSEYQELLNSGKPNPMGFDSIFTKINDIRSLLKMDDKTLELQKELFKLDLPQEIINYLYQNDFLNATSIEQEEQVVKVTAQKYVTAYAGFNAAYNKAMKLLNDNKDLTLSNETYSRILSELVKIHDGIFTSTDQTSFNLENTNSNTEKINQLITELENEIKSNKTTEGDATPDQDGNVTYKDVKYINIESLLAPNYPMNGTEIKFKADVPHDVNIFIPSKYKELSVLFPVGYNMNVYAPALTTLGNDVFSHTGLKKLIAPKLTTIGTNTFAATPLAGKTAEQIASENSETPAPTNQGGSDNGSGSQSGNSNGASNTGDSNQGNNSQPENTNGGATESETGQPETESISSSTTETQPQPEPSTDVTVLPELRESYEKAQDLRNKTNKLIEISGPQANNFKPELQKLNELINSIEKTNGNLNPSMINSFKLKADGIYNTVNRFAGFVAPGLNLKNMDEKTRDYDQTFAEINQYYNKFDEMINETYDIDLKNTFLHNLELHKNGINTYKAFGLNGLYSVKTLLTAMKNGYESDKTAFDQFKSKLEKFATERAKGEEFIKTFVYPKNISSYSGLHEVDWLNKDTNMAIFNAFAKTLSAPEEGDYFPATEENLAYNPIFEDQELMTLITKYRGIARTELLAGRGEYGSNVTPADMHFDEADIDKFDKLIAFNDSYTRIELKKINKLRKALGLNELIDLSQTLTKRQKIMLIMQSILGYEAGLITKENQDANPNKKVKVYNHVYAKQTKEEVVDQIRRLYGDNYYSTANAPLRSAPSVGVTAEFLSSVFMKTLMGERLSYEEKGLDEGDFGHLIQLVEVNRDAFYAAVIVMDEGPIPQESFKSRNNYRVMVQDMYFSKNEVYEKTLKFKKNV
ncbi:hypothetical protein H9M94_00320 [Mycoplasma sp. Pen4]|uniref:GA module-containing protein n=1 Tax=Mycoplasma sp. Pen4 TaxID=640330 RepID=UPI00165469AB|nr:GA module-containing protein [Mycoplasma sp. Pen4]QNM93710.1 hypothetical protein H9M94_00320 [Mycoplasma sp. Pen4]